MRRSGIIIMKSIMVRNAISAAVKAMIAIVLACLNFKMFLSQLDANTMFALVLLVQSAICYALFYEWMADLEQDISWLKGCPKKRMGIRETLNYDETEEYTDEDYLYFYGEPWE